MKKSRILSLVLSMVMTLSVIQVPTSAKIQELSLSPDTVAQYADGMLASVVPGRFINGSLTTKYGGAPRLQQRDIGVYSFWYDNNVDDPNGCFVDYDGTALKAYGKDAKIADYNMIMAFGMKNDNTNQAPQEGFSVDKQFKANASAIALGGHDSDFETKRTATIKIKDNPKLYALAQSGDLQIYFSGIANGAVEDGCGDGASYVSASIYIDGKWVDSTDYSVGKQFLSTDYFRTVGPNSEIKINVTTSGAGCNYDKWAGKDVGIEDAILLFRKASNPNLTTYTLTSNGDRYTVSDGSVQALLGKNGKLDLEFSFSEPVVTALSSTVINDGNGALLKSLANRALFSNTPGTGYPNQNCEVYMKLTSVIDLKGKKVNTNSEYSQYQALKNPVKVLHYTWTAGLGNFYGDNPLPNDGDWAGEVTSSNIYNMLEMINYASFHDQAGNPLLINGKLYGIDEHFANDSLQGTIGLNGGYVKKDANNPFTYANDAHSGFDFVIDAVDPQFSSTSNPIQPNILTKLTLNKNDTFDIDLNFAKAVKLRMYFENGAKTGYLPENLEILFTNGMTAKYKSGIGTKVLTFTVDVDGNESINTRTLEVKDLRVKTGSGYATDKIIVDYVGNPLLQRLGNASIRTTMSGSNLTVDNTAPVIKIDRATDDSFRVNVTDNMDDGAKSAVFHVANATGEDNGSGLFYYLWVNGEEDKEKAIADLTANNYAMLKKASLGVPIDEYSIKVSNNNAVIDIPSEVQNGGTWFLLVFSADMTWDSARQLIQYQKASYKTKPDEYYNNLMTALGIKLDGDLFTELKSRPVDWDTNYTNYYTKDNLIFTKVPQGDYYPDFYNGTFYKFNYNLLTSETEPANWKTEYTNYYTNEEGEYVSVPMVNGAPMWKADKYYNSYEVLTSAEAPENWDTELLKYYIREDGKYFTIAEKKAPKFVPGMFYEEENIIQGIQPTYKQLATEPADWKNTYYNYFWQNCLIYNRVLGGVPSFIPNEVYKFDGENYNPLATEPSDWQTNFDHYYDKYQERIMGITPPYADDTYCKLDFTPIYGEVGNSIWSENYKMYFELVGGEYVSLNNYVPKFVSGKYYKAGETKYTVLTQEPADWNTNFSYFELVGGKYVKLNNNIPKFESGKYYKLDNASYEVLAQEPADWNTNFTSYYGKLDGKEYYFALTPYPTYESGKYYQASGTVLKEKPEDWNEKFNTYYYIPEITYTKLLDKIDFSEYGYEPNKYYKKIDMTLLEEKPADWKTDFSYYQKENGEFLKWQTYEAYEKDKFYSYSPEQLTEEPVNWAVDYRKYYELNSEEQTYETAKYTEENRLEIIPEFSEGEYYGGSNGINDLADRIKDKEKRQGFVVDMLGTKNSNDQVEVIRGFSEFANEVYTADVKTMELGADYESWSNNDFSNEDSNWTYSVVSTVYDKSAPTVVLGEEGVLNDNSENVSLPIIIDDEGNDIAKVEYQLAQKGTSITADTNSGWLIKDLPGTNNHQELVIDSASYAKVYGINDGEYDVYVRTSDTIGNIGCTDKLATIKINTNVNITTELSKPTGKSPYSKISNVNFTVSGNVSGSDVLDCGLKVYYAFDENYSKTDLEGWTELTGESGVYSVPEFGGVSGSYYLHIKYEYQSAGTTVVKYKNEFYAMDGAAGDITFNQVGFSEEGLSIEVQAKNANQIYYQVIDDVTTEITADSQGWIMLPANNTIDVLKEEHQGTENVRVWAKNGDIVRSEVYNLGASSVSGKLPTPAVSLLALDHKNNEYNAVVKFEANEEMLGAATEYSYSIADSKTAISDLTWHRWVPYESMVNISMGESVNNKYLYIKFKNGKNITEEKDYIIIKDFKVDNQAVWATVNRNTFKNVSPSKGVQLQFVCKEGYSIEDGNEVTKNANGLYKFNILDSKGANCGQLLVSINNIDSTPPGYSLSWSDSGVHSATSGNVRVTVNTTEDVTFKNVEFTSQSGEVTHPTAINTFNFKENGVCKFTFADEVGNESVATAKVTWIDLSKPEFDIIPDYTDYITVGSGNELYASGVKLVLKPKKIDSFVSNGTDSQETFYLNVTENGTYTFSMGDSLGNYVSKSYTVSNLITGQDAPKVVEQKVVDGKVLVKLEGTITGYASGNRLFDGKSNKGIEVNAKNNDEMTTYTCNNKGEYTITKKYSSNGIVCMYVCDSLGYSVPVDIQVSGLDTIKPVIKLPEAALQINKGATLTESWWKQNVEFYDNITSVEDLTIKTDIKINTNVTGAYAVVLTARDNSGNETSVKTTLYVVPTEGMIVMSDKGVLFSSASKDAALIDGNTIKLTVKNFDLIKYKGNDVSNKLATYSVIVKKGLYREGQMKYFDTRINDLTFTEGKKYSTVLIDTNLLSGTGWYTIIIRTAERDREYTTFFISK